MTVSPMNIYLHKWKISKTHNMFNPLISPGLYDHVSNSTKTTRKCIICGVWDGGATRTNNFSSFFVPFDTF